VERQAGLAADIHGELHAFDRLGLAVLCVLEAEHFGSCEVIVVGLDDRGDVFGVDETVVEHPHRLGLDAAEHRRAAGLVAVCVGGVAGYVFVAAPAVGEESAEVGLRAAGDEQRGLLAEPFGHGGFEPVDGGVVAEHVVANLGFGDGLAHPRRWFGDGVGSEVDHPPILAFLTA